MPPAHGPGHDRGAAAARIEGWSRSRQTLPEYDKDQQGQRERDQVGGGGSHAGSLSYRRDDLLDENAAELRAFRARAHFGREPYLSREGERPRPVAFAHAGKMFQEVGRRRAATAPCEERVNEITAPGGRRPISGKQKDAENKKPAAGFPARTTSSFMQQGKKSQATAIG
jgi:hypothetical protein